MLLQPQVELPNHNLIDEGSLGYLASIPHLPSGSAALVLLCPVACGPLARLVTHIGFGPGPAAERGEGRKQLRPIREREGDRHVEGGSSDVAENAAYHEPIGSSVVARRRARVNEVAYRVAVGQFRVTRMLRLVLLRWIRRSPSQVGRMCRMMLRGCRLGNRPALEPQRRQGAICPHPATPPVLGGGDGFPP